MKRNNKGFTLAELLIVVAIIAVLVAIAIPVFTARLEQSRETTDLANLRSAYAAGQVAAMNGISDTKTSELSNNNNGSWYFNPNDSYGLVKTAAEGTAIGQGTGVDGQAYEAVSDTIASQISYVGSNDVRGHKIEVIFDASGLSQVKFAD